jgi:transposase-like protein
MDQRDIAGRPSFYRTVLQERSRDPSVPLARFCRKHGISPWTYYYWKRRLGHKDTVLRKRKLPAGTSFVPVSVIRAHTDQPYMEVRLREGTVIRISGGYDKDIFRSIIEAFSPAGGS